MDERGIAPVVGVVLLVAITLLLASTIAISLGGFAEFGAEEDRVEGLLNGSDGSSSDSNSALALTKDPGEEPRTSGDDVLEFRVENTRDSQVTVVGFEVDATGIETGVTVDDGNADEVEVRRADQTGKANRDGDPGDFAADGTRYEFTDDSTGDGQEAVIGPDVDDAEVDVRRFSRDIGPLEIAGSEGDGDLIVRLILSDGSEQSFYFEQT